MFQFMDTQDKKKIEPNEFSPILGFLVILLAFVCWMNFGPMLSFGIYSIKAFQQGPWAGVGDYLVVHAPYFLMFLALYLGSKFILKTNLSELITGKDKHFRWKYASYVALIYIAFLVVVSFFQFKTIRFNSAPFIDKLRFLLPVLILTPMQALSEEIFFRVLPARLIYHNELPKTIKSSMPLIVLSGFLFLIPHLGNPEVSATAIFSCIYYFLWGASAMVLGLYTDGFEAPVVMHIANNLYIALIVNYSNSSMPTEALFTNAGVTSSIFSVFEVVAIYMIIIAFTYKIEKSNPDILKGNDNAR